MSNEWMICPECGAEWQRRVWRATALGKAVIEEMNVAVLEAKKGGA